MLLYFKDKDDLHHMQVHKERKKKDADNKVKGRINSKDR